jgi:hypothetical protein
LNYAQTWRSTAAGASAEWIKANFGTATAVTGIALGNVNFRSTATIKIQANATDSWGSPSFDRTINCANLTGYTRNLYDEWGSQSYKYWRISMLDDGNPDGFLEVGQWFLGSPITLNDNFDASYSRKIVRGNIELRTEYEQAYVYQRDYGWQFDLSWTNCQLTTVTQLRTMSLTLGGNAKPFFFVLDPTDPGEAYYVRIRGDVEENRVYYDRYNTKIELMEEMPGLSIPR